MSKSGLIIPIHINRIRTEKQLRRLQSRPLEQKVNLTERRIMQFAEIVNGKIYLALSGGKDSTVLLHIVRNLFPDTPAVFCNTGVEFPEIVRFVRTIENVIEVTPNISFPAVVKKYGYPMVSKDVSQKIYELNNNPTDKLRNIRLHGGKRGNGKLPLKWRYLLQEDIKISHKCCDMLKDAPALKYEKETGLYPIIGKMAAESWQRNTNWKKYGCNAFSGKRYSSNPLSFWTTDDIWEYIETRGIEISEIYKTEKRTGCMYCLFGCQFDDEDGAARIDRLKDTHPKHYRFAEKLGIIDALELIRPKKEQLELFNT